MPIPVATKNKLHIQYYNARSLLPKFEELCAIVEVEKPDIICIVETWLSSEIEDNEVMIDNYQIIRQDRNRHGGGVLMYINSCLSVKVLSSGANSLELLYHMYAIILNTVFVYSTDHHPHALIFLIIFVQSYKIYILQFLIILYLGHTK